MAPGGLEFGDMGVSVGVCRKAPSGDPAPDEPADDPFRDARAAGRAHVPLSPRGDAVGVEPQRERGLERDERPLAFPQYLPRSFARERKGGPRPIRRPEFMALDLPWV